MLLEELARWHLVYVARLQPLAAQAGRTLVAVAAVLARPTAQVVTQEAQAVVAADLAVQQATGPHLVAAAYAIVAASVAVGVQVRQ